MKFINNIIFQTAVSQVEMFLKAFLIINCLLIIFSKHFLIEIDDNNGTSNTATMDDYPNNLEDRKWIKQLFFFILFCLAYFFSFLCLLHTSLIPIFV